MTHEEFQEKALREAQSKLGENVTLVQAYSSRETLALTESKFEKHLAIFNGGESRYLLVAEIGNYGIKCVQFAKYDNALALYYEIKEATRK